MKKIFAILCGVTMMFAACTTPEGGEGVEPIFPQAVTAEVLAGDMYTLTFDANTAWTVSLENDYYAQLSYNNGEGTVFDTEVSGVAGEGITVRVIVNEAIKNYDADVVIPVSITMGTTTQTLATLTVKQIERPAAIVINEIFETVTFAEGHPSYSEFHNAQKQYSLNYSDKWDLEGVSMTCNLEGDYAIKVHAYNEGKQLADVTSDYYGGAESWVSVETFGTDGGFKVVMDLSKESAEWSWFETQYEAYVNFEDAEGNVLVSLFCSSTYKEGQSGGNTGAAKVSFVNESMASNFSVSIADEGNDSYTLTYNLYEGLMPDYHAACGIYLANADQLNPANQFEGILELVKHGDYYHLCFTEAFMSTITDGSELNKIPRNYSFDVINTVDWSMYTVKVVLGWVPDASAPVSIMSNMASQVGVVFAEGGDMSYTYTFYSPDAIYSYESYGPYIGLQFHNATEVKMDGEGVLELKYNEAGDFYTIAFSSELDLNTFNPMAIERTHYIIDATLADGANCSVIVVLDWMNGGNPGIGGQEPLKK